MGCAAACQTDPPQRSNLSKKGLLCARSSIRNTWLAQIEAPWFPCCLPSTLLASIPKKKNQSPQKSRPTTPSSAFARNESMPRVMMSIGFGITTAPVLGRFKRGVDGFVMGSIPSERRKAAMGAGAGGREGGEGGGKKRKGETWIERESRRSRAACGPTTKNRIIAHCSLPTAHCPLPIAPFPLPIRAETRRIHHGARQCNRRKACQTTGCRSTARRRPRNARPRKPAMALRKARNNALCGQRMRWLGQCHAPGRAVDPCHLPPCDGKYPRTADAHDSTQDLGAKGLCNAFEKIKMARAIAKRSDNPMQAPAFLRRRPARAWFNLFRAKDDWIETDEENEPSKAGAGRHEPATPTRKARHRVFFKYR